MNIAAIHLITANAQIGSPVLSASVLIFGDSHAREDFVVSNWEELLRTQGDPLFAENSHSHIQLLINTGARIVEESLLCSRVLGVQARFQTAATVWQNHYESHVSHYAYLYALTGQKRDVMLKGWNFDGFTLNAANRFIAEDDKSYPTGASNPSTGLQFLKELYIAAKRLLGHDINDNGAKIVKVAPTPVVPTLPSLPGGIPGLPSLPVVAAPALPGSTGATDMLPPIQHMPTALPVPPTIPTLPKF